LPARDFGCCQHDEADAAVGRELNNPEHCFAKSRILYFCSWAIEAAAPDCNRRGVYAFLAYQGVRTSTEEFFIFIVCNLLKNPDAEK
jgi:hypothetical protein